MPPLTSPAWTAEQLAVLQHPAGAHAVVRAAPGAGKTTTLVGRVRHLLEAGEDPRGIRVVMFNRAVQQTFAARLGVPAVRITTFDALGLEVLRAAERDGLLSRPLQVDPDITRQLARHLFRDLREHVDEPDDLARVVAFWKAHLVPPAQAAFPENPALVKAYQAWEEARLNGGRLRVGYEDMVYTAVGVLGRHPRLLGPIQHLLVDEFQDVNPARVELLRRLIEPDTMLMVVGDEDQGINEWAGAHPRLFQEFNQLFPSQPTREYRLSTSFRFGPDLARAATRLIGHNPSRTPNEIIGGGRAGHVGRVDDVGVEVRRMILAGTPPQDIAVLYRGRPQGAGVMASLAAGKVPMLTSDIELLRTGRGPELALTALRLAVSREPVSFDDAWTVVFAPDRYIQKDAFRRQVEQAGGQGIRPVLQDRALATQLGQSPGAVRSLRDLDRMFARMLLARDAAEALDVLLEDSDVEGILRARLRSEREQETAIASFHALHGWLRGARVSVAEAPEAVANLDPSRGERPEACVWVSTIHKAKGLEWRHVFLPGLIEGACPAERRGTVPGTRASPAGVEQSPWMEQERRIFFVGLTRAIEGAYLHAPGTSPSRFVAEVEGRTVRSERDGRSRSPQEVVEALVGGAPRSGNPWTADQDELAIAGWDAGKTIGEIGEEIGRSSTSVAARLVRLQVVESRAEARMRG